jgi:Kef-type K+ transport system membrane component KefB
MTLSKYVLPTLFSRIAKIPEMMLLMSVGWCFGVCAVALGMGLSMEMGR